MSPYDWKLQEVHRDPAWMTGPDGLVRKAEQTIHFLKDLEEKAHLYTTLGVAHSSSSDWKRALKHGLN